MIIPTIEQIKEAKTWTQLLKALDIHPRNDRAANKIKEYVRSTKDGDHLERYKTNSGRFQDDEFKQLVASCFSAREVIVKGGWVIAGGSYAMIYKRIDRLGIDTTHFKGQAWNKGRTGTHNRPLEDYLTCNGIIIASSKLKARLFNAGIKDKKCEECEITEWRGLPAPLQLDHIDGNNTNNILKNLRILCPNCHAQTPTYAGKNKKIRR